MSVYRCNRCEGIFDADYQGIEEDPFNEIGNLCEGCHDKLGCFSCGEVKKENACCKITDQYFCQSCI